MFTVLLSTYNGRRFLGPQIQSLCRQSLMHWRLLVRDDGSTDETLSLLRDHAACDRRIQLLGSQGKLGAAGSYLHLLQQAPESEYYAFCDQDDVWNSDKLERAGAILRPHVRQPAMYCSRLELVDENMKRLGLSRLPVAGPSLGNALVQNIATGCTVVLNHAAVELLTQHPPACANIVMHDWWCYLVLSALGRVVYDPRPTVAYRQHGRNAVGEYAGAQYWIRRYRRFMANRGERPLLRQLREFERRWGKALPRSHREQLRGLLSLLTDMPLRQRRVWLAHGHIRRQTTWDTLLLRTLLLLRRM